MLSNINKLILSSHVLPRSQIKMLTRSQIANFSTEGLKVNHDVSDNKFYIVMSDSKAFINYEKEGSNIKFTHTEVPEVFRGKGVAKILAKEVFSYAVKNKLNVEVECDYLKSYFDNNENQFKTIQVKYV